jgi:hypothetical protein
MGFYEVLIKFGLLGDDGNQASPRQGVAGVSDQIHQNLFNLSSVRHYEDVSGRKASGHFNVFPDEPSEKLFNPADKVIQIHWFQAHDLLGRSAARGGQFIPPRADFPGLSI